MKLSNNFTMQEVCFSKTAIKHNIDNKPTAEVKANIVIGVNKLLQPLRDKLDCPITITSGYRSPELNSHPSIKGSKTSQHMEGKAYDIQVYSMDLKKVYKIIMENFDYDQLILEYNTWIHVSYNLGKNRKQNLIIENVNGKKVRREFSQGEF